MGAAPSYATTPSIGAALLGSAETSLTAPTTTSTIITAGASGSKIEAIQVQAIATTVAGLVYVFLHDGSAYRLFDVFTIPANTASSSVAPIQVSEVYDNLLLETGWSLRMSQSIAGNASLLVASAFGGDF
jgi:hypothetical protein